MSAFFNFTRSTLNHPALIKGLSSEWQKVAEILDTGSDFGRTAAAGIVVNLMEHDEAESSALRRDLEAAGVLTALQRVAADTSASMQVREIARMAIQNSDESPLAQMLPWSIAFAIAVALLAVFAHSGFI